MKLDLVDVEILVGYSQDPMFFDARDGRLRNRPIEEAAEFFGFSDELTAELQAWDDEYQATLNMAVPQDSDFPSEDAYAAWLAKGKELAARIKRESRADRIGRVGYQADDHYDKGECVF